MFWKIYYENNITFSSDDGTPWEAPRQGVLVIVQSDSRVGWRWISGFDFFYFEEERGGWRETSDFGMYDHLIRSKRPLVLFGRWINDETWFKVFARVKEDLGEKQGWLMTEDRRDGST